MINPPPCLQFHFIEPLYISYDKTWKLNVGIKISAAGIELLIL